jgi:Flp pilus assembly pilin Flp
MVNLVRQFLSEDQGQDLIEYTLLLAFVALASSALFLGAGRSVKSVWTASNSQLTAAAASATT